MKSQSKGDDEKSKNNEELREGSQYLSEHHNIDSKFGELAHEEQQARPGEIHRCSAQAVVPIITPAAMMGSTTANIKLETGSYHTVH